MRPTASRGLPWAATALLLVLGTAVTWTLRGDGDGWAGGGEDRMGRGAGSGSGTGDGGRPAGSGGGAEPLGGDASAPVRRPGAAPGWDADGASATGAPALTGAPGRDWAPGFDPRLVPGQRGVGVPEGREGGGLSDPGTDPRYAGAAGAGSSPQRYPPPPLVPPETPDRPRGVPPTPQGAGARAREVVYGEEDPLADSAPEPSADAVAAWQAEMRSALISARAALRPCFDAWRPAGTASGQVPALLWGVGSSREEDGSRSGWLALVELPSGEDLPGELAGCVLAALDSMIVPVPPGTEILTLIVEGE